MLRAILLFAIFFATLKNRQFPVPVHFQPIQIVTFDILALVAVYTLFLNLRLLRSLRVLFFYIVRKKPFH